MTKNEELRSQWQPIETAPKDQTVMVWWGEGCWWGRKSRTIPVGAVFPKGPYAWTVKFGDGLRVADPTHWMPLPQPPTNATAQPSEELRSVKALREIAVEGVEEQKRIETGLYNLCEMGLVRPVEETRSVARRVRKMIDRAAEVLK